MSRFDAFPLRKGNNNGLLRLSNSFRGIVTAQDLSFVPARRPVFSVTTKNRTERNVKKKPGEPN